MSLIDTFVERMEPATFAFAWDGQTDMMSLNPLEHTNFEMMGSVFAIGGVLLTLVLSRIARRRAAAECFTAEPTGDAAVEQYP